MATKVILLERVEKLGNLGDVVSVKPGYARNYLLPQNKALRASKQNIAYFESQKKHYEAENEKLKKEAEKRAKDVDGKTIAVIRQASESGQLYGSVASRDIAQSLAEETGQSIERRMVSLNQNLKTVGLFPIEIVLHPEVTVTVTVNIARTPEEADIQLKSGKALTSEGQDQDLEQSNQDASSDQLEGVLEEDALEAVKAAEEENDVNQEEETAAA